MDQSGDRLTDRLAKERLNALTIRISHHMRNIALFESIEGIVIIIIINNNIIV